MTTDIVGRQWRAVWHGPKADHHECVHLVTRGHRLRDKDDSHTIQSAIFKNPMPRVNFVAVFYRTRVMADQSFTLRNKDFRPILLQWPWPWPDNLHVWSWPVLAGDIPDVQIWTSYIKAFESYHRTDTTKIIYHARSHYQVWGQKFIPKGCGLIRAD